MTMFRCCLLTVFLVTAITGLKTENMREKSLLHRSRRAIALTEEQKDTLVEKHNALRRLAGASDMEQMKWDSDLARMAAYWADRCVFEHGFPPNEQSNDVGQNIYVTSRSPTNLSSAIQYFYNEIKDYNYNTQTCTLGKVCGHYTQVVYAESTALGCAVARCSPIRSSPIRSGEFLVCNYRPARMSDKPPYQKGTPCTKCPSGHGWCDNGLCRRDCKPGDNCECKANCGSRGVLNRETCSCDCQKGWMGADCSRECKDYNRQCGGNPGWPKFMCQAKYPFVLSNCPLLCGLCERPSSHPRTTESTLAPSTESVPPTSRVPDDTTRQTPDPVSPTPAGSSVCKMPPGTTASDCANSGVYNEETKTCACAKGWMGVDCSLACEDHNERCGTLWRTSFCHFYPSIPIECPLMCGLCEQPDAQANTP